ncbi:hypothetical protein TNCV_3145411 [Trichonephila clavipes]|nr:hypothetical protein TNCV_3145411 [Trichonephila clavipes]
MPTSAMKDLLKKWEDVRAMVLEWHPNQVDVSRVQYNITITQAMHPNQIRKKYIFLLHHNNARLHRSAQTQDVMGKLKFTVVPQLSYNPNLAPSDLWLFSKLKEMLKGQHFSMDAKVQVTMRKRIHSQPDGMKKWIESLNKCVVVSVTM